MNELIGDAEAMITCTITLATATASPPACGDAAASSFCHEPPSSGSFQPGIAYPSARTLPGPSTATEAECCCACAAMAGACNGWTLHPAKKECWLKTDAGPTFAVNDPKAVSALMPPPPPFTPPYPTPKGAKNVLFLAVDDMRPSLGAYNFTLPGRPSHSPNIDKLAATGTLFTRAYVQYAYCSPSRNSFMTGRRPDTTKVWEFKDHFREVGVGSNWTSMPQYFKQHGYLTLGTGKLYHPSSGTENIGMPFMDWPASWSPEYPYDFPTDNVHGEGVNCSSQGPDPAPPNSKPNNFVWCALELDKDASILFDQKVRDKCVSYLELAANTSQPAQRSTVATTKTVEDDDGRGVGSSVAASSEAELRNATDELKRPFFIGCGFHKPHAPYYAPREFFDKLPAHQYVPLPLDPFAPVGMPTVAWHPYADTHGMTENPAFNGTVNMTRLGVWRRSYYAAISYTDYNIGVILDKLQALGMVDDTIVVNFGDHGYQLGEHDTWAKMTNFELGVHIPLIIRAPMLPGSVGKETAVLAEMVDIYPTLAELAGLPRPQMVPGSEGINGTSLVPAIADPSNTSIKAAAFSQFAKDNVGTSVNCQFFRNETQLMGYTIRTDEWRYTSWFRFDHDGARGPHGPAEGNYFGRVLVDEILGRELYDHRGDSGKYLDWPGENVNLVDRPEHAGLVKELHARLLEYIRLK